MSVRRVVLVVTCVVVTGLGAAFAVMTWDEVGRVATVASALAGVLAAGIAIWAALPGLPGAVRVSNTGPAKAGHGGTAVSGMTGAVSGSSGRVEVDGTGAADASDGGDATSGLRLN